MELNINIQGTAPSKQDIEDYRASLIQGIDDAYKTIKHRKWVVFIVAGLLGAVLFGVNSTGMISADIQSTTALMTTILIVAAGVVALREGQQHYLASMPLAFFVTALFASGVLSGLEYLGIDHQMHSGQFNLVSVSIMFLAFLVCLFSFALIQYFIIEKLGRVDENTHALLQIREINRAVDTHEALSLSEWQDGHPMVAQYLSEITDRPPMRMEYRALRSYVLRQDMALEKEAERKEAGEFLNQFNKPQEA